LLAGKAIWSAVFPRISTAGSLQRQSLDFGPFLQEYASGAKKLTIRHAARLSLCTSYEGHWDFAVGSASIDLTPERLTSLARKLPNAQGYSISDKKLTFLDSPDSVIIPAAGLCNLTEP
jgi:hypothetical protein